MGATGPWCLALFSLCLLFSSGQGTANLLRDEENQEIFSSSDFSTPLDGVPIVNPTTPGTENPFPTVNPTSPQAPDTTGQTPAIPNTNPTSPQAPDTTGQTPAIPNTNPASPQPPNTTGQTPTIPTTTPTAPTIPTTTPTAPTNPTTTPTAPTTTSPASSGGQWCVASQSASDTALQVALDYACGYGGTDCSAIQSGASCYNPNTLHDHASYAFNDYYQKNPAPTSCAFGGTATLTNTDPSKGNCHYASSKSKSMSPPTYVSQPSPPSPPNSPSPPSPMSMTPTTPSTTMPGGSTVYGSEPTESPNSATSATYSLLLLFTICGIWASLLAANHT